MAFGPLMFLIFINDITTGITYHIRLFADDCIIYRPIISQNDHTIIQNDLDTLATWLPAGCVLTTIATQVHVTTLLSQLHWHSLRDRREYAKLTLFHNAIYCNTALEMSATQ